MTSQKKEVNIAFISDIHGVVSALPKISVPYDLILIGGDLTSGYDMREDFYFMENGFLPWLDSLPTKEVHATFGNHDKYINKLKKYGNGICSFHINEMIELFGLKFFFTPYTRRCSEQSNAFTCETEDELYEIFSKIPSDVDVIVSHAPPAGVLDKDHLGRSWGSHAMARVLNNNAVSNHQWNTHLQLFLCGHTHHCGGQTHAIERVHSLPLVFGNGAMLDEDNRVARTEPLEFCIDPNIKWELLPRTLGNRETRIDQPRRPKHRR